MILITHLFVALSSIIYASYLWFQPSKGKFTRAYWLVAATIGTGILLVWQTHSKILSSCISGLIYLAVVSLQITLARRRLLTKAQKIDD